jgi:hypothetical protein
LVPPTTLPPSIPATTAAALSRLDNARTDNTLEADEVDSPNVDVPSGAVVPATPEAGQQTKGLAGPQAGQVRTILPAPGVELARATDACFADGSWLSSPSLAVGRGPREAGNEGGRVALAGLVLTLALEGAWPWARRDRTGERDRLQDPSRRNEKDRPRI